MIGPSVVVLDYGSGNLRSAERALTRAGAQVTVTAEPTAVRNCDGLVVPGVGAFAACMAGLTAVGGVGSVHARVTAGGPTLGICVGMQVLFERGEEHAVVTAGLGVLPGVVGRLEAPVLPHMGWNTVVPAAGSGLFAGVEHERFYFVHSYAALATVGAVTTAEHGQTFVAAVEHGALWATQFHPEKSGWAGAVVIANWVRSL